MAHPTTDTPPAYAAPATGGIDGRTSASDTKGDLTQFDSAETQDFVYVPDTEEERRLVRKIDLRLIPMLWVMYILNYVSDSALPPRSEREQSRVDTRDKRAITSYTLGLSWVAAGSKRRARSSSQSSAH